MKGIELANYIVSRQIEKGQPTNTLSLQKIIYFVNAEYIKEIDKPEFLTEDVMEKWKFGPVIPEVYREYSFYGPLPITELPVSQFFEWDEAEFAAKLDAKNVSLKLLNEWIDKYADIQRFELVNWTHKHKAWKNYEEIILSGKHNLPYTGEELYQEIKESVNAFFTKGS